MPEQESNFQGVNYYVIIPAQVLHDNRLTPLARLIYGELSSLANIHGFAWISNRRLAEKYKVSKATISAAISKLQEFEYIRSQVTYKENSKEIEQRNLFINPIQNNLNTLSQDILTGYSKKLKGGIQKNLKDNNTSNNTPNNTINSISDKSDSESVLENRFEILWKLYPNKKGKPKAFAGYKRAIKGGATDKEIKEGLDNYLAEIEAKKTDKQYIKHGSTWFNSKGWEDDYDLTPSKATQPAPYMPHFETDEDLPF